MYEDWLGKFYKSIIPNQQKFNTFLFLKKKVYRGSFKKKK